VLPGEIVTAKVNIRMLSTIPASALGNRYILLIIEFFFNTFRVIQ